MLSPEAINDTNFLMIFVCDEIVVVFYGRCNFFVFCHLYLVFYIFWPMIGLQNYVNTVLFIFIIIIVYIYICIYMYHRYIIYLKIKIVIFNYFLTVLVNNPLSLLFPLVSIAIAVTPAVMLTVSATMLEAEVQPCLA